MKRTIDQLTPIEFQAGRLMLGLSVADFATETGFGADTLRRLEKGVAVRLSTRKAICHHLWDAGVRFTDHRDVLYCRGGPVQGGWPSYAPTQKAVGRFHGERLRKACWHLRINIFELASVTGIPIVTIKAMMVARDLNASPTLSFFRVVLELQCRGFTFARRTSHGLGDRPARPRPPARNPNHQFKWRQAPQPFAGLGLGRYGKAEIKKEIIALADQLECSVDEVIEKLGFAGPTGPRQKPGDFSSADFTEDSLFDWLTRSRTDGAA